MPWPDISLGDARRLAGALVDSFGENRLLTRKPT